tara:strand:+ start:3562 stop:4374 length:813 start_codon:yes stop_codon:yes gene_type:complete
MVNKLSDIVDKINEGKPLSIVRMGNVEAQQMLSESLHEQLKTNAGFFGNDEDLKKWKSKYLKSLLSADCNLRVISCPSFVVCDLVLTKLNLYVPTLPYMEKIEFWWGFINNIKTNKIGFVSYFKKDIERQVSKLPWIFPKKKDKVWSNKNTNDWKFIYSENTIEGNEPKDKSWFDVFDDLVKRTLKEDCDIYFISCGCYGLPLCDELKKAGKQAIYIGGILQLLFGLKGKRWDNRENINCYYNKYWTYPQTKPKNFIRIENGCYWGHEEK